MRTSFQFMRQGTESVLSLDRLPALRYILAVGCGVVLTSAIIDAAEMLAQHVMWLGGERPPLSVITVAGIMAVTGLVLAWRSNQRGSAVNATARRQGAAVESARRELERLVTGLPVAVYQGNLAPNGQFTRHYLTSSIVRVTGWTAEQIPTYPTYLALIPSEDRQMVEAHYGQTARDGEATTDYRLRRPDGSLGWFRQQTRVATLTADGVDLIGTLSDITKKHELAEQVASNEARFRGFLVSSPDALIITDRTGTIVMASQLVETVFGYKPAEIIGQRHGILVPTTQRVAHAGHLRDFFDAPEVRDMGAGQALMGQRKDGSEFPIEVRLSPYRGPDGLFVIAAVRDITQRLRGQDQLRQAQKMEAVGELTGGVAHDFNNLLTTILGNAELLGLDARGTDAETTALITAIRRAGERAALLTRQLLAFSRKQSLHPEVIDLNVLIVGMMDMLRQTLGGGILVKVAPASGLWSSLVDGNQFENAILNVAINARDAMPNGGRLLIETSNTILDDDDVAANADLSSGPFVLITVSDNGEGMTDEILRRVFEPFYTTKPIGQGTGLGLSQVYGFVNQSDGHLTISSHVGLGSSVKIYLPRHFPDGKQGVISGPIPNESRVHGTETVLVVEDDASVRDFTHKALTRLGYHVHAVDSAAAALMVIAREPLITLLFTDIGLPVGNGRQLAADALLRLPGLRVLFTTGYAQRATAHDGSLGSNQDILAKPFTIDILARTVRGILDRP